MSVLAILAIPACVLAVLSAILVFRNLALFRPPARSALPGEARAGSPGPVSVLIPARDEAGSIGDALESVLGSRGVEFEVIVLDDDSSDATAAIVETFAAQDPRVRLERGTTLPAGWCGKQHARARLADLASHPTLLFVDADVRVGPEAVARAAGSLARGDAALVSGFPRQIVVTPLERLLIPLVHFLLLAYLPIDAMRRSRMPGLGAGCGQFMMVRRDAYERLGGHGAIRASLHDGLLLPRAFRAAGFETELIDVTSLATCRMYRNAGDVWRGLRKNAIEGTAAPGVLGVMSTLLLVGQVLPFVLLGVALLAPDAFVGGADSLGGSAPAVVAGLSPAGWLAGACALVLGSRIALARRFATPLASALLHPLGVLVLLAIQWEARWRSRAGLADSWKGRAYGPMSRRDASG